MVDINLIGDDKTQPEGEESSENFSNTYSADTGELTSESHLSDSDFDQNIYDRTYTKSGSKKTIFTIVGLIVVAVVLVVGWYLTKSPKDISQFNEQQSIVTEPEVTEPEVTEQEGIATEIPTEIEVTEEPIVEVPISVQEMINSTQRGVKTVESILVTIPQDINFTLVRYQDGDFLAEILGSSTSDINNVNMQLQQRFSDGNVQIISQGNKNMGGYTYQQALLNGGVSNVGFGNVRPPIYMNPSEVKNEFIQNCEAFGLTLKQFDIKNEIRSTDFRKIPVMFSAIGNTDSALNFLNNLVERNVNVNLSKISFLTIDGRLDNSRVKLILNIEIYHPI